MAISGPDRWLASSSGRRVGVLLPLVLILDLLVVVALGLLPLESISDLRCDAVLRGGEPKADPTLSPLISTRQDKLCSATKSGRVLVMLGVGIAILIVGAGSVLAPADRLETALVSRVEDDEADRRREEAWRAERQREAEGRATRLREDQASAERAAEAEQQEAADRRADRVARARAARMRARSQPGARPTKKAASPAKKAGKATKATKKVAKKTTKKVAKKVTTKASKKVTTRDAKKVAEKVTGNLADNPAETVATRVTKAGPAPGKRVVSRTGKAVGTTRQPRNRSTVVADGVGPAPEATLLGPGEPPTAAPLV